MRTVYVPECFIFEAISSGMYIISASRRTDIPAFHTDWFAKTMQAGYVNLRNPFNNRQYTISLQPEDIHSIVFWSKNFAPLLPILPRLDEKGIPAIFHYTITGLPGNMEPGIPGWREAVGTFRRLAEMKTPDKIFWRFDPVIFTGTVSNEDTVRRFELIARSLFGYTDRCYLSFADFYKKVTIRLTREKVSIKSIPKGEETNLAKILAGIASEYGIQTYACCEPHLICEQIHKASCIDGELLRGMFPDRSLETKKAPQRKGCGCYFSYDIGAYNTCPAGCLYCYANR